MSEERLQEIKDSVEFQYKLAKVKCIDNSLLFADEERELIEEIERLNNIIKEAINYTTKQMKKYEGYDRDFEIVLSNIVVMLGSDKE